MDDENLICGINYEMVQVPLEGTLRPSLSRSLHPKNVSERSLNKLSTFYQQIQTQVIHNCPVDSQICNTFPGRKLNFI